MTISIRNIFPDTAERCIEIQKNDGFRHAYFLTKERIEKLYKNGEKFYGVFDDKHYLIGFASINVDLVRLRIHFFSVSLITVS